MSLPAKRWPWFLLGMVLGGLGFAAILLLVLLPAAIGRRNTPFLEGLYGDAAVELAVRTSADNTPNPLTNNPQTLALGRANYTTVCAACHGANGGGDGLFGPATTPSATDLRGHDTQNKSDAQLFWIIKHGISFTGMPGFANQLTDQDIWALVTYTRSLGTAQQSTLAAIP